MRLLFVHQNFPGQYLHILRHLIAQGGHEIWFITNPNQNKISGVKLVHYPFNANLNDSTDENARDFELAMKRARAAAAAAQDLKTKVGFVPDVIVGHHGWG